MNEVERLKDEFLNLAGRDIEKAFDLAVKGIIKLKQRPGYERGIATAYNLERGRRTFTYNGVQGETHESSGVCDANTPIY